MTLDHFTDEPAITRSELYKVRGNGHAEPEELGSEARTCAGCGGSLEHRDARARWCSDTCKKRAKRANGNGTEPDAPVVSRNRSAILPGPEPDGLAELVAALTGAHDLVLAVSVEYSTGWCATVARAGD